MRSVFPLTTFVVLLCGCAVVYDSRVFAPSTAGSAARSGAQSNPLLAPWTGPYGGVPPWDQGTPERYREAIDVALAERRAEYAAISADPAAPTFDNTFLPIQRAGRTLSR